MKKPSKRSTATTTTSAKAPKKTLEILPPRPKKKGVRTSVRAGVGGGLLSGIGD